jgi:hypothetical protein
MLSVHCSGPCCLCCLCCCCCCCSRTSCCTRATKAGSRYCPKKVLGMDLTAYLHTVEKIHTLRVTSCSLPTGEAFQREQHAGGKAALHGAFTSSAAAAAPCQYQANIKAIPCRCRSVKEPPVPASKVACRSAVYRLRQAVSQTLLSTECCCCCCCYRPLLSLTFVPT